MSHAADILDRRSATPAVPRLAPRVGPALVISLDFELFWGVAASRSIRQYGAHVEGEWRAIPAMLEVFRRHGIKATWATVGMLMCRDHAQWRSLRPRILPGYARPECSTYALDEAVRNHPRLFFARGLVQRIGDCPGQELASHTYSHFYCGEEGATPEQFAADLECANEIGREMHLKYSSLVFPRNQLAPAYLGALSAAGISVYRGNPRHWLYRRGHQAPAGMAGRTLRFADSWLPLSGSAVVRPEISNGLVDVHASHFLRPWSPRLDLLEPLRMQRLKQGMTRAAQSGSVFHLWWHPHNFGLHTDRNIAVLERLLEHYRTLRDRYGMQSMSMGEFATS